VPDGRLARGAWLTGASKPDRRTFKLALGRLGAELGPTLFTGDTR
jgi:FMN phosphatase YigB (HAD superfamily)